MIGINTAIISPTGGSIGLGFSIPAEIATNIIDQLRQFGVTKRGWLGVRIQDVTDDVAKDFSTPPKGALVAGVEDDGPAKSAGILAGDIIVTLDGKPIDAMHALPRIVAEEPVGKVVSVDILRDGKPVTLSVTIGLLKEAAATPAPDATKDSSKDKRPPPATRRPPPERQRARRRARWPWPDAGDAVARSPRQVRHQVRSHRRRSGHQRPAGAARRRTSACRKADVISMVGDQLVNSPDEVEQQVAALKKNGNVNARLVVQNKDGNVRWVNLPVPATP